MRPTTYLAQLLTFVLLLLIALAHTACDSGRSYAEMLADENKAVNRFLINQRVSTIIPADSMFEAGPQAPYYLLDQDNNIYMQVLERGQGNMAKDRQSICFRFTRWALTYYVNSLDNLPSEGNQDSMAEANTLFRFNDYTLPSSAAWGSGIQMPLRYLPLGSRVNLVVKSQYGWTSEVSKVTPYLYNICYNPSNI